MKITEKFIPRQTKGEHNDVTHCVVLASADDAHQLFKLASTRLKDIGNWQRFSGPAGSAFCITDASGEDVYKMAEKGDIFYIDMPGPGSIAGKGADWVRIETFDEMHTAAGKEEYIAFTVRPTANPKNPQSATAHFFSHESTNTFIIERYNDTVIAGVFGRNETHNTEGNIIDKVRNTIVGLTARHGLSAPHWQVFIENLLKSE